VLPAAQAMAVFQVEGGQFALQVQQVEGLNADALQVFPAHPTLVEHADAPFIALNEGTLQVVQARSPYFSRAPESVRVVLVDPLSERGVIVEARQGTLESIGPGNAPGSSPGEDRLPLAFLLLLALFGGVLLNLMPCVFPVLSLKAMSLVSGGAAHAGRHGWAYTAGVVTSFAVLAGALLALRAGGEAIGWGFQLQSPGFVALLIYLFFAMALSLSGVFELGTRWMGLGQDLSDREGLRGSFFTGALATLVASPCTAPAMGTALGAAAVLPAAQAMAVFLALGFGLALPMLVLSLIPALARALPKPGPWMLTFRQLMAFPLYLTVVWLLSVLGSQVGSTGMSWMLAGLVALAFALWLAGHTSGRSTSVAVGHAAVGLALLGALAAWLNAIQFEAPDPAAEGKAQAWSVERLAELNADPARGVLVNMTADWCVTCKVNEAVALSTDTVQDALIENDFAYLVGDWTRRDPAITGYLAEFGRNGVPLYVLYPPGPAPEPIVLPQLLTPGSVAAAVRDAATGDD
jgi:thiol:disulfide interchange protein DsbD